MKVIVIGNQSLFDIAIQEDGTILTAFDWAVANEILATDSLIPGQTLINPNSLFRDSDVANYFQENSKQIATTQKQNSLVQTTVYGFPYLFPIQF